MISVLRPAVLWVDSPLCNYASYKHIIDTRCATVFFCFTPHVCLLFFCTFETSTMHHADDRGGFQ